jgi:tRNA(adenine34) deaminase
MFLFLSWAESPPLENKNSSTISHIEDERWMRFAIEQASLAVAVDEVPVGAIVVYQNKIIGRGFNQREKNHKITGHAELIAMEEASQYLKSWRLTHCTLYVTLEPCLMCTGALIQSRIERIVYGAKDEKTGGIISQIQIQKLPRIQHLPLIQSGVLELACQLQLRQYFEKKRYENE